MPRFTRLLSIACISFAVSTAAAQAVPTVKPLVWKTFSNSKADRAPDAIFWFNQQFIAVDIEWQNGKRVGLVSRSALGNDWQYTYYDDNKVLVSANGREWKVINAPGAPEKGQVAWAGNKFRVIDTQSMHYESEDGVTWTKKPAALGCGQDGGLADIRTMRVLNGVWFVLGRCVEKGMPSSLFAYSRDQGATWAHAAPDYYLRDIAYSPALNRFVATGHKRVLSEKEEVFAVSQ